MTIAEQNRRRAFGLKVVATIAWLIAFVLYTWFVLRAFTNAYHIEDCLAGINIYNPACKTPLALDFGGTLILCLMAILVPGAISTYIAYRVEKTLRNRRLAYASGLAAAACVTAVFSGIWLVLLYLVS